MPLIAFVLLGVARAADVGDLSIVTEPPGASISIDGAEAGVAPVVVPGLSSGEHWVVAQGACGRVEQSVLVPGAVQLRLPGGSGTLSITVDPPDATIELDGTTYDVGSRDVLLPCGDHVVGAIANGFAPRSLTVTVRAHDVTPIALRLEPHAVPSARRLLRPIAGGLVVAGVGAWAVAGWSYRAGRGPYQEYLLERDDGAAERLYDEQVLPRRNAIYVAGAGGTALTTVGVVLWVHRPVTVAVNTRADFGPWYTGPRR